MIEGAKPIVLRILLMAGFAKAGGEQLHPLSLQGLIQALPRDLFSKKATPKKLREEIVRLVSKGRVPWARHVVEWEQSWHGEKRRRATYLYRTWPQEKIEEEVFRKICPGLTKEARLIWTLQDWPWYFFKGREISPLPEWEPSGLIAPPRSATGEGVRAESLLPLSQLPPAPPPTEPE